MSKVKNYIDSNKEKARHRNRIDESRRIKAKRIRKCDNWTYNWLMGGYYHVTEHTSYRYEYIHNIPLPKAHVIKIIKPVSILKRRSTNQKRILKTFANRRFRRGINTSEENYYLPKGNAYKRVTNNKWLLW